jgi:hypothetical protein
MDYLQKAFDNGKLCFPGNTERLGTSDLNSFKAHP